MPDLFPTTEEASQDQAPAVGPVGIVNHLGPDSFKPTRWTSSSSMC